MNKLLLLGRIGNAELKNFNGNDVLNFSVATNKSWTDKQGQKQEKTTWHNCLMWGKRAGALSPYIVKGLEVYVEGEIEHNEKDGKKFTTVKVLDVQLLGSANGKETTNASEEKAETSYDDIPF